MAFLLEFSGISVCEDRCNLAGCFTPLVSFCFFMPVRSQSQWSAEDLPFVFACVHLISHLMKLLTHLWYASKTMQNWGLSTEEPLVKGNLRRGAWQNYNTADEITIPVLQISLPFPKQPLGVFGFWVWRGCFTPSAQMTCWYEWPPGSFLIDLICETTFAWIKESSGEEEASLDQWCCHIILSPCFL